MGKRVISETQKFETDETLLGAGRSGFFARPSDKIRDRFFAYSGLSGVNQMNRAVGPVRDETGMANPSVSSVDLGVRVTTGANRSADDINEITVSQVRER